MSLAPLWHTANSQIKDRHIRQAIAFAGDGRLLDGGHTSEEFREFLAQIHLLVELQSHESELQDDLKRAVEALEERLTAQLYPYNSNSRDKSGSYARRLE